MMIRKRSRRFLSLTGQAAVEAAIFGSLILVIFASLLSYMQRQNEEQYVTMEAFRRALQRANGVEAIDEGASVSLNLIHHRRFADLFGGFFQGNRNVIGGSASVFWAVPPITDPPKPPVNYAIFRLNDDELDLTRRLRLDDDNEDNNLEIRDTNSQGNMRFSETTTKLEDNLEIQNIRRSDLGDTVTTNIEIVDPGPNENDESDDLVVETIPVTQHIYRDADGQYKYSSTRPDQPVTRQKTWKTPF